MADQYRNFVIQDQTRSNLVTFCDASPEKPLAESSLHIYRLPVVAWRVELAVESEDARVTDVRPVTPSMDIDGGNSVWCLEMWPHGQQEPIYEFPCNCTRRSYHEAVEEAITLLAGQRAMRERRSKKAG